MNNYKKFNIIGGWLVFAIAAFAYISTMEPTASLWDCGEFIATSYKFEVGHPPGAPLMALIWKLFSLLAGNDVTQVAKMMNLESALASAFTVLFLFWSISYIARKIILTINKTDELTTGQLIAVLGSGLVGALAYTFSDTAWFSAVESEVYATSSMFTALVFWLALKWDEHADEPHSYKWLILIAYLMGLSIGVHLLNLLVIPAIGLVVYFKKYKTTVWGVIATLIISSVVLLVVMYGVIQGLVGLGSGFELLFVNSFGLPFNSGFLFYLVLLFVVIAFVLFRTYQKGETIVHTATLALLVMLIGYSSFAMLVIRSNANPPIDENDPQNTFALKSYLNREQYGDRPLISGQYYDAEAIDQKYEYTYVKGHDKYIKVKKINPIVKYDPARTTIFPRMYSSQSDHIEAYKTWGDVKTDKPTFGNNIKFFVSYQIGWMYFRYFMWNFSGRQNDIQGHGGPLNGNYITGIKFLDNLGIPQKDIPDKMSNRPSRNVYFLLPLILGLVGFFYQMKDGKTFWPTFIFFIMTGLAIVVYLNQTPYQPRERDYAYVGSFYVFAIWIGLSVVAMYEFLRKYLKKDILSAAIPTVLFLGVPILMGAENWDDHNRAHRYHTRDLAYDYLMSCDSNAVLFTYGDNDTFPLWYDQEVEGTRTDVRDVNLSLFSTDWYADQMLRKAYESDPIPMKLDRDKYIMGTRDVIFIYNNPNALFKEKFVANKSELQPLYQQLYNITMPILDKSKFKDLYPSDFAKLNLGTDKLDIQLFIGFVQNLPSYAEKLAIDKSQADSLKNKADKLFNQIANSYANISDVMNFALSDDQTNMLPYGDEFVNYIPTTKILIPVDKNEIKKLGFVPEDRMQYVGDNIKFDLPGKYLLKAQWFTLKMLADNNWERPIYFATGIGDDNYLGLESYFRLEGFAYRLMPYKAQNVSQDETGEVNSDLLYNRLMNQFKWGNINGKNFYIDHYVERQIMVLRVRTIFHRLADQLIKENKNDKAKEVLNKCIEILPDNKIAYDYEMLPLVEDYYRINDFEDGNKVANQLIDNYSQQIKYFNQFTGAKAQLIERDQQIAFYVLQNLYYITNQYNQKDVLGRIEPILQANVNKLKLN